MVMFREDYDKLLAVAPSEFEEPFFFQNAYTDTHYTRGHSQLRYNGTAAIIPWDVNEPFNQSIFIDIFVYDALPKNKELLLRAMKKAERLRKLMIAKCHGRFSLRHPRATLKYLPTWLYFCFHDFQTVFKQFERCYQDYDGELSDVYSYPTFVSTRAFTLRIKKEWYAETLYMPFEDMMIPVPSGYDRVLRELYGDYQTPVKAPATHGPILFDPHRSYEEVLRDIKSGKIDINKYLHE